MKKKYFAMIVGGIILALSGMATSLHGAAEPRWNILFCFADDWGR